jgi:hypothetical protein
MPMIKHPYYDLACFHTAFSPADSSNYYWGGNSSISTTPRSAPVYFNRRGVIVACYCSLYSSVPGTGENISLYVRLNDGTDYLINTVGTTNNLRTFSNLGLNIPIVAGDYVEIKMVTPAWVTNPTGMSGRCDMLVMVV